VRIKSKNLGSTNEWKAIPKEIQECINKGHTGVRTYSGKAGRTIHLCPKCKISFTSDKEQL
jgi:hypothetical protein